MKDGALSTADRDQIARHGLTAESVRHQLELLRDPPSGVELARPATVGDGVVRITAERRNELLELYEDAAARGRFSKLVPASGAASRMFKSLAAVSLGEASEEDRRAWQRWLDNVDRFPFRGELAAFLEKQGVSLEDAVAKGATKALLPALLDDGGLGYLRRPKGLVPFHRYAREVRTPFDEHLVEAGRHIRDREGRCRLHFTILEQHEELFREYLEAQRPRHERELAARFDVGFSFQEPSTDTVAADLDGGPFRDRDGRLVIRPGGHGALIKNVARLRGDLVFIKNIDNVVPDERRGVVLEWKKLLAGCLLALERCLVELLERAERGDGSWVDDARSFLTQELRLPASTVPASADALHERLDRPLRVCGVVPVTGEPGGGPFWIRDPHGGESLQIVETSQVDTDREDQAAILGHSTHFNPVDLVCRLRDHRGAQFDLDHYIDPDAVFVARKSYEGRPLLTLEHPGLWNGAMARWNTLFVEVPGATFAPVKTVFDLLRDEHQVGTV